MNPLTTLVRYYRRKQREGPLKSLEIPSDLWQACFDALAEVWVWNPELQREVKTNQRFMFVKHQDREHFAFKGIPVFQKAAR